LQNIGWNVKLWKTFFLNCINLETYFVGKVFTWKLMFRWMETYAFGKYYFGIAFNNWNVFCRNSYVRKLNIIFPTKYFSVLLYYYYIVPSTSFYVSNTIFLIKYVFPMGYFSTIIRFQTNNFPTFYAPTMAPCRNRINARKTENKGGSSDQNNLFNFNFHNRSIIYYYIRVVI